MAYLIYLNSRLLAPSEYDGSQGATFTIRQTDGREAAFSFGGQIRFTGQAASDIKTAIINSPTPISSFVKVQIQDDCCNNLLFEGKITYEDVSWCEVNPDGSCIVEVSISDDSPESAKLACLKNTVISSLKSVDGSISSQGPDEFRSSLYPSFCTEARPASFQFVAIVTAASLFFIVINLLGFFSFLPPVRNVLNTIQDRILGCGKRFKAPFVHSYLANACKLCGLGLDSPIFNPGGFLHNMVRVDLQHRGEARTALEANEDYFVFNRPSLTVDAFLDSFSALNIGWLLDGNTLKVDRKDRLSGGLVADLSTRSDAVSSLCFSIEEKQLWAGRYYRWPDDQSDKVANQLNREYSLLVDYNNPSFNPDFSGVETVDLGYAFLIYNNTYLASSVYNLFANNAIVRSITSVPQSTIIAQTETRNYPVLAIWDGSSTSNPVFDVRPFKLVDTSIVGPPLSVTLPGLGTITFPAYPPLPNLYSEFLAVQDPRNTPPRITNFELVFSYECSDIGNVRGKTIRFNKGGVSVVGFVEEIEIDPESRQMTVRGKV